MVMDFDEPNSNLAWGPQTKLCPLCTSSVASLSSLFSTSPYQLFPFFTLLSDSIIDAAFIKDMR